MDASVADRVRICVSVDSSAVGNPVQASVAVELPAGATAYDALLACGVSVDATDSFSGVYVRAIDGLGEKQHGALSGWMYRVNGRVANMAAAALRLNDGDAVGWFYATG